MFLSLQFLSSVNTSEQAVRHFENNIGNQKLTLFVHSELSWIMLTEEGKCWKNNLQLKNSVDFYFKKLKISINNGATVTVQ